MRGISPGQAGRRRSGRVRWLIVAISAVIGLFVPVLFAVAKQCQAGIDCVGTDESDKLYGSSGPDRIFGRGGDDRLAGRSADDRLFGGLGSDHLNGHDAGDHLYGENGDDLLIAGDEPDEQGRRIDWMYGGRGNDELHSDSENDWMDGGRGSDVLYGTRWRESLMGGAGDDRIYGGAGVRNDWYDLRYGAAADWGHDVIFDGSSRNHLTLATRKKNHPNVRVNLNPSPDRPEVRLVGGGASVNWRGHPIRHLHDGSGDDTIRGSAERNRIWILDGRDRVFAGRGNDHVQASDDGGAVDKIRCGAGRDSANHKPEDKVAANCERTYVIPD